MKPPPLSELDSHKPTLNLDFDEDTKKRKRISQGDSFLREQEEDSIAKAILEARQSPVLSEGIQNAAFSDSSSSLSGRLSRRSHSIDLQNKNIIKVGTVAPSLIAVRQTLQFKKTAIMLEHKLETRPLKVHLVARDIIPIEGSEIAPALRAIQRKLQFLQKVHELQNRVERRPNVLYLLEINVLKGDPRITCNLQALQQTLKFQTTVLAVAHKLENRRSISALVESNIIKRGSVAPNLQATQQALKFQTTALTLDHSLQHRRNPKQLQNQNIIKESQTFHKNAESLEQKLERRPDAEALVEYNILKVIPSSVASSLANTQQKLNRQRINDNMNHKLPLRRSPQDLKDLNILKSSEVSNTLQLLNRQRVSSILGDKIDKRPTVGQVVALQQATVE